MLIEASTETLPSERSKRAVRKTMGGAGSPSSTLEDEEVVVQTVLALNNSEITQSTPCSQPEPLSAGNRPTNVAQIKQLSPFRYPGGKTWLIPEIRKWLRSFGQVPEALIEPFAGGAMAGLTAAAEDLADSVTLSELDEDVAAVWQTIFGGSDEEVTAFCNKITKFKVTLENVQNIVEQEPTTLTERAFRTIIKNRMQRGGIMAAGAGLIKAGEAGKGLKSRWYPDTLAARIKTIRSLRLKIAFIKGDAFHTLSLFEDHSRVCFFVDPPYTAGGKQAGKRLYNHNEVDHKALFKKVSEVRGAALLTYDDSPEVRSMAASCSFNVQTIPMKNTHHEVMQELLIFKQPSR